MCGCGILCVWGGSVIVSVCVCASHFQSFRNLTLCLLHTVQITNFTLSPSPPFPTPHFPISLNSHPSTESDVKPVRRRVLRHLRSQISSFRKSTASVLTVLRQHCLLRLIYRNVHHQPPPDLPSLYEPHLTHFKRFP